MERIEGSKEKQTRKCWELMKIIIINENSSRQTMANRNILATAISYSVVVVVVVVAFFYQTYQFKQIKHEKGYVRTCVTTP